MAAAVAATRISQDVRTAVENGSTIPASWYPDPAIFELEKERIFGRCWQFAGLAGEIPEPGDFITRHAGHIPIIVVRDNEGQIRSFVNVCRHRGTQVVDVRRGYGADDQGRLHDLSEDAAPYRRKGSRKSFQCSYHAWTYGLDGCLRGAPRSDKEEYFNKSEFGLIPLKVETWGPMIFVNPDLESGPLSATLGTLPHLIETTLAKDGVQLESILKPRQVRECALDVNWKVTMDNYHECYHCPVNHPALAKDMDVSQNYAYFDEYEFYTWYSLKSKSGGYSGYFSYVWPNFGLGILGNRSAFISLMLPMGLNRSVHVRHLYFHDSVEPAEEKESMDMLDQVTGEDKVLCEAVQRGLESGMFDTGIVMRNSEMGVHHFHKLLARTLSEP